MNIRFVKLLRVYKLRKHICTVSEINYETNLGASAQILHEPRRQIAAFPLQKCAGVL